MARSALAPAKELGRPRWFLRVLAAFIRRELAMAANYRLSFFFRLVVFAFGVLSLVYLSRFVGATLNPHLTAYGGNYLAFVALGFVVADLQQVAVRSLSERVRRGQIFGTLEAELAAPAPPWMALGAGPVYEMGVATLRALVYILGAWLFFDVRFAPVHWPSLLLGVLLIFSAFSGLGLLTAATTMLVRRTNPVALLLGAVSWLLSGIVYPASVLPPSLHLLAQLLPLTHALEVLRGVLLRGATVHELAGSLLALALFALVLSVAGLGTFVYALRRARIDGSLTHT